MNFLIHMDDKVYSEPSETQAVDGVVSVEGPDGVSVLLTPDAAIETSERLLGAAVAAHGQRVIGREGDAKNEDGPDHRCPGG